MSCVLKNFQFRFRNKHVQLVCNTHRGLNVMFAPNEQRRHRDVSHKICFVKRHNTPENTTHPLTYCIAFFRTTDVATNKLWDWQFTTEASDNVPDLDTH